MPQSPPAQILYDFMIACGAATSPEDLSRHLLTCVQHLGFDYVNVSVMRDPALPARALKFGSTNTYPEDWQKYYADKDCVRFDPVVQRARGDVAPFYWKDLPRLLDLTHRQSRFLGMSDEAGLYNGIGIPFFGPRALHGGVALATSSPQAPHLQDLGVLGAIVDTFYRSLRALHAPARPDGADPEPQVHLTEKETEILCLALRGHGDRSIARLMGITENTVNTHLRRAFQKLGAKTRIQAVMIAVKLGLIDLP